MKTKITILTVIITVFAAAIFFSCDNPVALGTRLDLDGPVLTITSPTQRQSVTAQFDIEGTVYDYSGIDRLIISAVINNEPFPRQWRWKNGIWEISDDYGTTWLIYENAEWNGQNNITWKVAIDMDIAGQKTEEGEYTFQIQAWDKGDFTDDKSFKAIVLIVDLHPPKVVITNPYLYSRFAYNSDDNFIKLDAIKDTSDEWQEPSYLGKFITQEFDLKWQIEDNEVRLINISFYTHDIEIDDNPDTPLPENYIYRYYKSLPLPTLEAGSDDFVKLSGSVRVPNLYGVAGTYDGAELNIPIPEKTTVKVVAVCYDAAGNPNEEKTLGYFISWPKANKPWILFTEGMEPPDNYYGMHVSFDDKNPGNELIEDSVFTVYPGRNVKATAFQAHGVKEVKYTLYKCDISGNILHGLENAEKQRENVIIPNQIQGGTYSTIFPWEFDVPPITGIYIFTVEAFSSQGISSGEYKMLFRVHDITFPNFTDGPYPTATDPLFMAINNNKITIHGTVSDATEVVSLCMVWINPESRNFSAMSQLSYFRDSNYPGWKEALKLTPGTLASEVQNPVLYPDKNSDGTYKFPYDPTRPNKLWNIVLTGGDIDYDTNRKTFDYSQEIDLDVLNIGIGKQPLKSQVFLLRAENPDGKCTIVTYAPQGDTLAPSISISSVEIKSGSKTPVVCYPNKYAVLPQFEDGDTITINGTWWEDSVEFLPKDDYFKPNFGITVNNQGLSEPDLSNIKPSEGTWTITTTVGSGISKDKLKDTLVISVTTKDIGGNQAEAGSSWLIQSDNLRLMRISSEDDDDTYKAGYTIKIFLEFSKPVKLNNYNGSKPPYLILSSASGNTARAEYVDNYNQNSRQYFSYQIQDGHTTNNDYLNVIGLYCDNVVYGTSTDYAVNNYPFTWSRGNNGGDDYEEVRITMKTGNDGNDKSNGYYVRTLPTTTTNTDTDYQFTLTAGKHITIDTAAPSVVSIKSDSKAGDYNNGDIYFTVTFNEAVKIGTPPRFTMTVGTDPKTASYVRVDDKTITFMYSIVTGDTSNGAEIFISDNSYTGEITDLAGNLLPGNAVSNLSKPNRTLTGIYVDTIKPDVPFVRLLSAPVTGTTANALVNIVNNSNITAESGSGIKNLSNLYNDNLYLAIQGTGTTQNYDLDRLQYSINDGVSWIDSTVFNNTGFALTQTGSNIIKARQIDRAGNVSDASQAVSFTWDKGTLITRISSTSANGTYSHNERFNTINITVYFRKPLSFTTPSITLNAKRGGNSIPVNGPTPANNVTSLSFNYTVIRGDSITGNAKLDVDAFTFANATDGTVAGNGVKVSNFNLSTVTDSISTSKDIYVDTSDFTNTAPTFILAGASGTSSSENDTNFHGIRTEDGSYWTTLQIPFNHTITKGAGDITIRQNNTGYRLPAVLTETQYNRFKNVADIDNYYIKGTNGFNGTSSDTSTKYVLQYKFSTDGTGTSPPPAFISAFRNAEVISINVNAQVVTLSGDGKSLNIRLTGSSAPQVPGASYEIEYPAGLVTDSLDNSSAKGEYTAANAIPLGGVAKPFVRINKTQDTITTATASMTQPRLVAAQPFLASARIDCRTPGSSITYTTTNSTTNVTAVNWGSGATNGGNGKDGPDDNDSITAATPGNATTNTYTNNIEITFGYTTGTTSPTIANVEGFQWRIKARAGVSTTYSSETEEIAYRTVITYQLRGANNANMGGGTGYSIPESGDQVWIRGGDAIGSSSVPGFPFTWEDDWNNLKDKRAGIRLMTKTVTADNLLNSTWKFVTWDINTTAYIDFILGRDTATPANYENIAWQYGPKQLAYQRAGWTSYKDKFPIFPGKHRWCDAGQNNSNKGGINFSGTFFSRPDLSVDHSNVNQ